MVHDKVNILADKTHNTDRLCKSKREDGIYQWHTSKYAILSTSPDWFHDDYELQIASLFNCCYKLCMIAKDPKDMAECPSAESIHVVVYLVERQLLETTITFDLRS